MPTFSDADRDALIAEHGINSHTSDGELWVSAFLLVRPGMDTRSIFAYLRALRDEMARAEQEREHRHA